MGSNTYRLFLEGKRMVSGFIGNEVPRKGLRVRFPCPPLKENAESDQRAWHFFLQG